MKIVHFLKENWKELSVESFFSFSISTMVMPELIHLFFVVLTGLVSTVAMFILNRWLKKIFPEKK
jgi:hypothetical protein